MQIRSLSNMEEKKKASITVFLSLILVLLFSMILTTFEGARLQGAKAYLALLADMAEDSLAAAYYYPLFREYRLFAIDGGAGSEYFSEEALEEKIRIPVSHGIWGQEGGVLSWDALSIELDRYDTLLTENAEGFFKQVREQMLFDGATLLIETWFDPEELGDAAQAGEILLEQEKALSATATVVEEWLGLMEDIDGIKTSEYGLKLDKEGRLQANETFVKQLVPAGEEKLRTLYDQEEVYRAVREKFLDPIAQAEQVEYLLSEVEKLEVSIEDCTEQRADCTEKIMSVRQELAELRQSETENTEKKEESLTERLRQLEQKRERLRVKLSELKKSRDKMVASAEKEYIELHRTIRSVLSKVEHALLLLDRVEEKQQKAQQSVKIYEEFLQEKQEAVSEELMETFEMELNEMKLYLGLTGQGYSIPQMRESLTANRKILQGAELKGFRINSRRETLSEMKRIKREFSGYTAEGLLFQYGEIKAPEIPDGNVFKTLTTLLSGNLLSLVGIEKENRSERRISGTDLASDGETVAKTGVLECMEELAELLQSGEWKLLFGEAAEAVMDKVSMELYCGTEFGSFLKQEEYTKLIYEREYLLFGQKEDEKNLACMTGSLLGMRTLLNLAGMVKNPERMGRVQSIAAGLVGFTGMPVLVSVVKYALLFLWAVEEAFVDVAAIMQGKKPMLIPREERIAAVELFRFSKELILRKAAEIETDAGPGYEEYLSLFSLLKPAKKQAYFALDLIQENIRYRYREEFRIRNAVVGVEADLKAAIRKKYNTGLLPDRVYQQEQGFQFAY